MQPSAQGDVKMLTTNKSAPLLMTLLLNASFLNAQNVQATLKDATQHNWYVRASTTNNVIEGRSHGLDSISVTIGRTRVPIAEISELDRRLNQGGGWKVGALLGTLGGGAFGVGLSGLCESRWGGLALEGALVFGGIGAVLGGVIGQLVRPSQHTWTKVWPL